MRPPNKTPHTVTPWTGHALFLDVGIERSNQRRAGRKLCFDLPWHGQASCFCALDHAWIAEHEIHETHQRHAG